MAAPSSVKKFQKEAKDYRTNVTFFVRVKQINKDYFENQAAKAGLSLSKYMDALFDSIRNG